MDFALPGRARGAGGENPAARPLLSLSLPIGYGVAPLDLVGLIQQADAIGIPGVAVGELTSTDSLVLLAAASSLTTSIRLETSIISVLTRSPSMLAMAAATLANLSGNRFVLGWGAGSRSAPASTASPSPTSSPGSSAGSPPSGMRWRQGTRGVGSFRLRSRAVPVPILVAAMNPNMVRLAGRLADGSSSTRRPATDATLVGAACRRGRSPASAAASRGTAALVRRHG
jgi:alkanesulfonate monooxygenase SsuD/methylene tetrahydromethanopterin reductase-like flavin-dependent oxidoreductase (luciferase family)